MPTPTKGPRLGGGPAHERLILANLATQLFEHDRITTTEAKAKRLRPLAERLITFAKRGDLHARRRVLTVVRDKGVVHRLFEEVAPDMAEREGGYTRIVKIAPRKGDNAPMAVIELVREAVAAKPKRAVVAEAEGATKKAAKDEAAAELADGETVDNLDGPGAETVEVAGADVEPADADAVQDTEATDAGTPQDDAEPATAPAGLVDTDTGATQDADPTDADQADFGADSAAPLADGSAPEGFDVKGNKDSMKFHVPGSRWYDATEAEVWFRTPEAAAAAGFEPAGGEAAQQVDDQA